MGLAVGGIEVGTVADASELSEHDESMKAAIMPAISLFIDSTGEIMYGKIGPTAGRQPPATDMIANRQN